ncbi:unnamed protein product [Mytilus edulis]|uniref:Uncharacterized protein n=1 Tax=Mytilus edulis TaxID=6550 RepID=A0A8S3SW72_MYTED|nr:unnamed protein product [Mytilus edulis]
MLLKTSAYCNLYGWADELQQTFAYEVIKSPRMISILRHKVEEYIRKSKLIKQLSDEEAKGILINIHKENNWLKKFRKIITDVLVKLNKVSTHEHYFINKKHYYDKLINKLKTDCMTLIGIRSKQIHNQVSCSAFLDAHNSDDSETDEPSEKSSEDCSTNLKISEKELNCGVETDDKSGRHHRQTYDFRLLYECTLILQTAGDNLSKIYSFIERVQCTK